jgi:hypothetical protein
VNLRLPLLRRSSTRPRLAAPSILVTSFEQLVWESIDIFHHDDRIDGRSAVHAKGIRDRTGRCTTRELIGSDRPRRLYEPPCQFPPSPAVYQGECALSAEWSPLSVS